MSVFISHDQDDKNKFDDVTDALDHAEIEWFDPYQMLGGRSLAEMLREKIRESDVCIFIGTHSSVDSRWCNAELGAFWSVGKTVVMYVADSSVDPRKLPEQFQGHLWKDSIRGVVKTVQAAIEKAKGTEGGPAAKVDQMLKASSRDLVGDMTRSELRELIESAIQLGQAEEIASAAVAELAELTNDRDLKNLGDVEKRELSTSLNQFLGLPETAVRRPLSLERLYQFSVQTTTAAWAGFARDERDFGRDEELTVYINCLLLRFDSQRRVTAAAVLVNVNDETWGRHGGWKLGEAAALVGRGQIGEVVEE
ncbi:MAG: toll/interleukin-1 receptor domain-containing protein [bacterium]|nr:toll/interleukin-1 receptor domain-containing protein [bacterium]